MIRPLRRVHRVTFTGLVVALPILLAVALLARPSATDAPAPIDMSWSIQVEGTRVTVDRPASTPEVLAYLEADASATAPGPGSRFLGTLAGARTTFEIPSDAKGQVLLFSPALERSPARHALP